MGPATDHAQAHAATAAAPTEAATQPLRVLLVSNGRNQLLTARELLAGRASGRLVVDWRERYDDGLSAIRERRHDVYLVDCRLGAQSGIELVREAFGGRPSAPVILLTGEGGRDVELGVDPADVGISQQVAVERMGRPGLERSIREALSHHRAVAELARSEERYALAIRAANDGIWDWDLVTDMLYLSPRWHAILGRPRPEGDVPPATWLDLVHPSDVGRVGAAVKEHLEGRSPQLRAEHRMRHADGGWRWVLTRGLATRGDDGRPTRMAGSMSDVTDRRLAQLRLQHDALHDSLTGLPNRTLFMDRVHQTLERQRRDPKAACSVLFMDIDRFKLVNDSLSHAAGDKLLVALAARLATAVRPGDTVARLGGDEFAVLLQEIEDSAAAILVADRILDALRPSFQIDGHELFSSVSVGIALNGSGLTPADLLANADIAMYSAKRRGRGRAAVFGDAMRRHVVHRLARETELRQVVESSLLDIHYQPIISLATGDICGMEALARWPQGWGQVSPSEFIPIAEDTGLIGHLWEQVLRAALGALAGWRRSGLIDDDVCMSVNLSGRQLDDPDLAAQLQAAIERSQVSPASLKLEITESTLISEPEHTRDVFAEVCSGGVGLHLDDFGTGYSSLSVLHRFPVDALKIDRSFVADLGDDDAGSEVIIRSTVAMAHSLGLPVIAEGIERPAQLRRLCSLGCEFGQGHIFSPAVSSADMAALLGRWSPPEIVELFSAA
ncbi:MAG TPA: EAL domain-containing protein [Solirubrobacteraceae bacterium]|jgi:diguanylate cyclase (GGDEF)-like protein/PAS domain S-box-containing protein|nr:EAL domain-containing protein [Solirubrobacteraceae bacterium]